MSYHLSDLRCDRCNINGTIFTEVEITETRRADWDFAGDGDFIEEITAEGGGEEGKMQLICLGCSAKQGPLLKDFHPSTLADCKTLEEAQALLQEKIAREI